MYKKIKKYTKKDIDCFLFLKVFLQQKGKNMKNILNFMKLHFVKNHNLIKYIILL